MELLDCVAFMLVENHRLLAEKRMLTKTVDPGCIAIPGGHVENGEIPEEALRREMCEELGIVPNTIRYVCTLLHRSQEFQRIYYFVIESWEGKIENGEADTLFWIPLAESEKFDLTADKVAISEYLRVYSY